jgi:hypothetical protein
MDRLSWASAGNQPGARKRANVPERGESREIEKMKNSGNEAKEYLKTKDIAFLNAANYACFACKFAQIQHRKEQKQRFLRRTKPNP